MKLEIRDLCVSYGGIRALKGISLSVEKGQIVTLIGANGAGKSTTLRAISGLEKAQSGSITYGGEELTSLPAKEIVRRGIIHVPEGRRVFPDMTVAENLKIGAFLRRDAAGIANDLDYVKQICFADDAKTVCNAYEEFLLTKKLPRSADEIRTLSDAYVRRKREEEEKRRMNEAQKLQSMLESGSSAAAVEAALSIIKSRKPELLK